MSFGVKRKRGHPRESKEAVIPAQARKPSSPRKRGSIIQAAPRKRGSMFGRVTWIPASAGMTVPAFAGMTANGVVQRSMLAANDGAVADSVTNPNIHLLISTPVLEARVDSARVASESGDTVRVVVFSTPPNLEGLPDSIREARMSDVAFLETRPRLTDYDTVVVVKENHQWRVATDARFRAGFQPIREAFVDQDSSLASKASRVHLSRRTAPPSKSALAERRTSVFTMRCACSGNRRWS